MTEVLEEESYALPADSRLQEYLIHRVLVTGGFGITYLGFDLNLNKDVIIKEYLPRKIAARADGRFARTCSSSEAAPS